MELELEVVKWLVVECVGSCWKCLVDGSCLKWELGIEL
jgi:hypothetical protein